MDKPNASYGYWLLIAIFVIATCGLVYELVAGALASYLLGDSVRQFSFIIGVYLFSMGIGAYLAKFIHHKLLEKFILIEIWIGVIGGLSATLLFVLFNYVLYFEPLLYTIVFSIGCLVGLEIPLLMQLMQDELQFKDLVSNVFAVDYIGALVASVLFPLVLVPYLGLMRTSLFFGMLNIAIAWVLAVALRQRVSMAIRLQVKAILVFLLLLTTFIFANDILAWSEKNLYDETILLSKTTPYQRIVLTHQKNNCKLYLNNNLQFASADEYRYHEALVHPVLSLAECVDQVLVLGGGDGLALREILKYPDVQQITLVDLDREMTEICSNNHLLTQFNQNAFQNP
ncbi:MAG TPA: polyamine aminopropyltransferase, partial [Chitinophagales bacterium]|nr:polyamine aminopropyltransferase [Chitinophagales bacterium]